jgi:hypothetical protein
VIFDKGEIGMLKKAIIQGVFFFAVVGAPAIPAGSQDFALGNWSKVKGQPELEYLWRVQSGNEGVPIGCVVQVRSLNSDSHVQYAGTVEFVDSSGRTFVRPVELNLNPGRVAENRQGSGCTRVTDLRISPRKASR